MKRQTPQIGLLLTIFLLTTDRAFCRLLDGSSFDGVSNHDPNPTSSYLPVKKSVQLTEGISEIQWEKQELEPDNIAKTRALLRKTSLSYLEDEIDRLLHNTSSNTTLSSYPYVTRRTNTKRKCPRRRPDPGKKCHRKYRGMVCPYNENGEGVICQVRWKRMNRWERLSCPIRQPRNNRKCQGDLICSYGPTKEGVICTKGKFKANTCPAAAPTPGSSCNGWLQCTYQFKSSAYACDNNIWSEEATCPTEPPTIGDTCTGQLFCEYDEDREFICQEEKWVEQLCPKKVSTGDPCQTKKMCKYGTETCCDQIFHSEDAICMDGTWHVFPTDACTMPFCSAP